MNLVRPCHRRGILGGRPTFCHPPTMFQHSGIREIDEKNNTFPLLQGCMALGPAFGSLAAQGAVGCDSRLIVWFRDVVLGRMWATSFNPASVHIACNTLACVSLALPLSRQVEIRPILTADGP